MTTSFWTTQLVKHYRVDEAVTNGYIIQPPVEGMSFDCSLPNGFAWSTLSSLNVDEIYNFLRNNYVYDGTFRVLYSKESLNWILSQPSDYNQCVGIRAEKSGVLVGFVSAIAINLKIYDKTVKGSQIDFLCVHKKLRRKRMAPTLIREITRRIRLCGIYCAAYTGGMQIHQPVSVCHYWNRPINPQKLVTSQYLQLNKTATVKRLEKLYALNDTFETKGFRILTDRDVNACFDIFNKNSNKFNLVPQYTIEQFRHLVLPRDNVVYSYVVENDNVVTDFVSFYTLELQSETDKIKVAWSSYYAATATPSTILMKDALIAAKISGHDVFTSLDVMDNDVFLKELKFCKGLHLYYYLYNWTCSSICPNKIGLVIQ